MKDRARQLTDSLGQFGTIVASLVLGATLGGLLAHWQAPDSQLALVSSLLLFPATVLLGWLLMLPLALLALPFALPGFLRWLRQPLPPPTPRPDGPRKAPAVGWVFVLAAIPTSLLAGLLAGAPLTYLLAGLMYGYALRRSTALLDVPIE